MFLTVKHTEREAAVRVVSGLLIMACTLLFGVFLLEVLFLPSLTTFSTTTSATILFNFNVFSYLIRHSTCTLHWEAFDSRLLRISFLGCFRVHQILTLLFIVTFLLKIYLN